MFIVLHWHHWNHLNWLIFWLIPLRSLPNEIAWTVIHYESCNSVSVTLRQGGDEGAALFWVIEVEDVPAPPRATLSPPWTLPPSLTHLFISSQSSLTWFNWFNVFMFSMFISRVWGCICSWSNLWCTMARNLSGYACMNLSSAFFFYLLLVCVLVYFFHYLYVTLNSWQPLLYLRIFALMLNWLFICCPYYYYIIW